ncbi:MAG: flagellar biosynthesis protein FlhF [Treponema sp.]|nr:flagellar biosynthesis protein FlhF [Treponema sp.]
MGLDILVERGASKGDCVHKIVKKYGIYFTILREKTVSSRGFFGRGREEVEVEFYLSPQIGMPGAAAPPPTQARERMPTAMPTAMPSALPKTMAGNGTTLDFEEAKKKVLAAARRDPEKVIKEVASLSKQQEDRENSQQAILDELKEIRESLKSQGEQKKDHPTLVRMAEILRLNDFSDRYTAGLMDRARKELPLETLENFDVAQNRFLEWIGESVSTYKIPERPPRKPGDGHSARIMVLVGPTGVGKTTTISKLAAIYGIGNISRPQPLSVRIITIDAFRIGAQHQIEGYAKIMEIPVSFIDNHRDLQREIDLHKEVADLILVDTIGRSPRDSAKLGEMKQILDACGPKAEVHLAISATVKTNDLLHIMRQFEPFDYGAVLLTKLDETRHLGNIISALAEKGKPVSYITDGQGVPKDIRKANVIQFLINLEEFRVDRDTFEKRFPATEADQFQWS